VVEYVQVGPPSWKPLRPVRERRRAFRSTDDSQGCLVRSRHGLTGGDGAFSVNRLNLQQLARERVRDAKALLAYEQWAGAYHMAGYALECALKSCILKHLDNTGIIFKDKKYLDRLSKCWTHDLAQLMDLANLTSEFGVACAANPLLAANWGVAKDWTEISRYEQKSKVEARELFNAITNVPNGVLPWIQLRW